MSRGEYLHGGGAGATSTSSYRNQPKSLPAIPPKLRDIKRQGHRDENKRRRRKDHDIGERENRKSHRREKREVVPPKSHHRSERKSLEDIYINTIEDNPFHEKFNKVIENPFLKANEIRRERTSSDESDSIFNSTTHWDISTSTFGQPEGTINTAIVDIYDSEEGCDPFFKMRVFFLFYL